MPFTFGVATVISLFCRYAVKKTGHEGNFQTSATKHTKDKCFFYIVPSHTKTDRAQLVELRYKSRPILLDRAIVNVVNVVETG